MNADELLEKVCIAKCKRRNTRQCAPICLSSFSSSPKCDYAQQVWSDDARAAIATVIEACADVARVHANDSVLDDQYTAGICLEIVDDILALAPKAE